MLYRDLRGWLDGVESFGELRVVEGAIGIKRSVLLLKSRHAQRLRRQCCSTKSKIIRPAGAS